MRRTPVLFGACIFVTGLFYLYVQFFWPEFDATIAHFLRREAGPAVAMVMGFISFWGNSYMMVASPFIAGFLFWLGGLRREALLSISVFLADVVNIGLKLAFNRARPEEMDIFPKFQQASFPSGHVVHYVVFFGFVLAVMLLNRRIPAVLRWLIGSLCIFLMAGVSVSRIYLGTHWATDILAAYIIGFIMLFALVVFYARKRPV
jgi:membrane-associated phospholipid phosphatase